MKILSILLLLVGCSRPSNEKLMSMAEDYCACQNGVYFISPLSSSFIVNCNNGLNTKNLHQAPLT